MSTSGSNSPAGLVPGLSRAERLVADAGRCIDFLGPDGRVYSTPSMVNDVEYACLRLIDAYLPPGQTSVGAHVAMDHLAATPYGQAVEITVRIERVDGRRVELSAEIRDALELVGRGRHVRVVVDAARQRLRIAERAARLPPPSV